MLKLVKQEIKENTGISDLAINAALTAVENKIPNIILVFQSRKHVIMQNLMKSKESY